MIIEIQQVKPRRHIVALGTGLLMKLVEKLPRIQFTGTARFLVRGPRIDFPRPQCGSRRFLDPLQNVAVAFAGGELLLEGSGIDARKFQETPLAAIQQLKTPAI